MLASDLFLMTGLEKSPIYSSSRGQVDFLAEQATLKALKAQWASLGFRLNFLTLKKSLTEMYKKLPGLSKMWSCLPKRPA